MARAIWLQTPTVIWLGGGNISLSYWVNDVTQTEIHTVPPLVPEPGALEVEMAVEKLKRHKSLGTD